MKKYKGIICSEPGVGKSTFALKSPKPFYVCTDENYQYLLELGAREEDHIRVYNWQQAKKAFLDLERDTEHETIVVDLFDDLHTWAEADYAKSKGKDSIMDFNDFGKSINLVKNDFISTLERLLSLNKNILLIMHGHYVKIRDKYGNETTRFETSGRMKEKVLEEVTGKVGFCLKAFATTQKNMNGRIEVKRWLSLAPSTDQEFGVLRGIDTETCPKEIELDWDVFVTAMEQYKLKPIINRSDFAEAKPTPVEAVATTPVVETKPASAFVAPTAPVSAFKPATTPTQPVQLDSLVEPDDSPIVIESPTAPVAPATPVASAASAEGEDKKLTINDLVNRLNLRNNQ